MSTHEATEGQFHDEMLALYWKAGRETGYWGNRYLAGVRKNRGLPYAKRLLRPNNGIAPGFQALIDVGRTDLSVEALVLDSRFSCFFTAAELAEATRRLSEFAAVSGS